MMEAIFISTNGTYLEATLEIEGKQYCVMDELTLDIENLPKIGESFAFEFSNSLDEDESWESIFQSNPEKKKCIEQVSGWRYRAFGQIISINPVIVDCGILKEEDIIHTNDPSVVGEFISFTISRLGVYAI
ncbi:hypothetical protein [Pseudoalteromonas sp. McH1-42]|uniref:hypothetical protein n=1 Tax=Pseudoalteromonas sp. McH1-42 TaxID=2917752 RepID=UPI001EF461AB|nr:hypothetical protein [Pseudoalteromonas sp. McH1-42]MCG7564617.1 hypothetical protein [Pseudoalteromonas sp. McH1-42]